MFFFLNSLNITKEINLKFEVTILVNDAEKASDIDSQGAQQTLEVAKANLRKTRDKRQTI